MNPSSESVLEAFRRAAANVPAYQQILKETGVRPEEVKTLEDFLRLPFTEKRNTFQRFPIEQLCTGGALGRLGSVLTSSGHSGVFAFGVTPAELMPHVAAWIDELLDLLFSVKSKPTLLINCLPMGVKVATEACTLAETSVRPDMVVGLVRTFSRHYSQTILVGEAAFIKHVAELGAASGVTWGDHRIHVIVGEEPLAENARSYLQSRLGIDPARPDAGLVVSSMGVAELGLNLFFEAPPAPDLIRLRRLLHDDAILRRSVLGEATSVPSLFTYDPSRIFVEFDPEQRLVISTLAPWVKIPLLRYVTGDRGKWIRLPASAEAAVRQAGISWETVNAVPVVAIFGRGDHALAGGLPVYPEAVKEGVYSNPLLAEQTTANFRLVSGPQHVTIRIQLSPGVEPSPELDGRFAQAIQAYVTSPFVVSAEPFAAFRDGMALDYERKFAYLS